MTDFTLIDLDSQQEAVAVYVKDWQIDDILHWMGKYGKVTQSTNPYGTTSYLFQSPSGKRTSFYFANTGELKVFPAGWRMY